MAERGEAEPWAIRAVGGAHGDETGILVGLIGANIARSRSPAMHEAEGLRLGLRYSYRLIDTDALGLGQDALPHLIAAAEACGFSGLNITHPFKLTVLAELDVLSREAEEIGAVNTVLFGAGRRTGHNTDCWGFAESFRRGLSDAARDAVLLLGAGGAGAAVARALAGLRVRQLWIADKDSARAAALARRLTGAAPGCRAEPVDRVETVVGAADGVINATPVGMAGHGGLPLEARLLRSGLWVADVVYVPVETALVRAARAAGCRVLTGAGMAAHQAARAFELFSGRMPDPSRMAAMIVTEA